MNTSSRIQTFFLREKRKRVTSVRGGTHFSSVGKKLREGNKGLRGSARGKTEMQKKQLKEKSISSFKTSNCLMCYCCANA